MKKYIILIISLAVIVIGVLFILNKNHTYTDSQYGFSITVPKNWIVIPTSKEHPLIAWGGQVTHSVNLGIDGRDYFSIIVVNDSQLSACKDFFTEETMCPLQIIAKKGIYTFAETHLNGGIPQLVSDDFYKKILPSFKIGI